MPRQRYDATAQRLPRALAANTNAHSQRFGRLAPRLQARLLLVRLERARQRLDQLAQRGAGALGRIASGRRTRIERASARLSPQLLANRIARLRQTLDGNTKMLGALSYQGVLRRGFSLIRDADGRAVRSASSLAPARASTSNSPTAQSWPTLCRVTARRPRTHASLTRCHL